MIHESQSLLIAYRYGSHFMTEKGQYLIDLIHAQRGFTLFQFTHKAQTYPRLLGQVNLCEIEHSAMLFDKGC